MASSRPEPRTAPPDAATDGPVAFALRELEACWSQAYEAMTRGDLQGVASLLDEADAQLRVAGDGEHDSDLEARLRSHASSAFGRLQPAIQAGMHGLQDELSRTRKGQRALRGYGQQGLRVGTTRTGHR